VLVRKQLEQMMPGLTKEELNHKAQVLALNPAIRNIIDSTTNETRARRELTKAIKDQMAAEGQLMNQEQALQAFMSSFTDSVQKQHDAVQGNMAASIQGIAMQSAALIQGKRAQAAI